MNDVQRIANGQSHGAAAWHADSPSPLSSVSNRHRHRHDKDVESDSGGDSEALDALIDEIVEEVHTAEPLGVESPTRVSPTRSPDANELFDFGTTTRDASDLESSWPPLSGSGLLRGRCAAVLPF